jgi:hypothetical protein
MHDAASCTPVNGAGGGGGSSAGQPDGRAFDSGEDAAGPETGSDGGPTDAAMNCGAALTLFQSPACGECLASSLVDGMVGCCAADSACSIDTGCMGILTCVLVTCAGGGCLPSMACTGSAAASSMSAYNVLAQCVNEACTAVCPPVPILVNGN